MNARVVMALMLAAVMALGAVAVALRGLDREGGEAAAADDGMAPGVVADRTGERFEGATMAAGIPAPDFALRDQDGREVRMRDLRGRPVIVTFLYTECDETCPPQAQQIKGALAELDDDVPALAVAVDPVEDTPAKARHFLAEQGMTGQMSFVLGTTRELRPVWDAFAIQPQLADAEHQARITLVDARGFQRVGYPLEVATPSRIAHDVRVLAAEAAGAG